MMVEARREEFMRALRFFKYMTCNMNRGFLGEAFKTSGKDVLEEQYEYMEDEANFSPERMWNDEWRRKEKLSLVRRYTECPTPRPSSAVCKAWYGHHGMDIDSIIDSLDSWAKWLCRVAVQFSEGDCREIWPDAHLIGSGVHHMWETKFLYYPPSAPRGSSRHGDIFSSLISSTSSCSYSDDEDEEVEEECDNGYRRRPCREPTISRACQLLDEGNECKLIEYFEQRGMFDPGSELFV